MGIQLADLNDAELDAFFADIMRLELTSSLQKESATTPEARDDHPPELDLWPSNPAFASQGSSIRHFRLSGHGRKCSDRQSFKT